MSPLRHLFRVNRERSQFEHDLSVEILKSERVRTRAILCILGGLVVAALVLPFVVPRPWNPIHRLVGDRFPWGATAIFYGLAFLYELGVYTLVGKAIT